VAKRYKVAQVSIAARKVCVKKDGKKRKRKVPRDITLLWLLKSTTAKLLVAPGSSNAIPESLPLRIDHKGWERR
jgi:hypothetical protein